MEPVPTTENVELIENQPTSDNSAIRAMRAQIDAANAAKREAERQAQELAAKLKEREDAELSEMERLKREADELRPMRDAQGKFATKLEALYQSELEKVAEDKRTFVEQLSKSGDWSDRLDALMAAKSLLPDPRPMVMPMGSVVAPGNKPLVAGYTIDPKNPPKLGDVLRR